jgi:hypothetical protein
MVQAVSINDVAGKRRQLLGGSGGEPNWQTGYFGKKAEDGKVKNAPQAFRIDMPANKVIKPHFHEVDQYQVFVAGTGKFGRDDASTVAVHYADHYTGYGPIVAGPGGFSYFTLRAQTDTGAVYLHNDGFREKLKPSRKRHHTVTSVGLSIEPVLATRETVSIEPLFEADTDGLACFMLRVGAGKETVCPDPKGSGGQYIFIVNGDLVLGEQSYPPYSMVWVAADDGALAFKAGPSGAEVLVLQYPVRQLA